MKSVDKKKFTRSVIWQSQLCLVRLVIYSKFDKTLDVYCRIRDYFSNFLPTRDASQFIQSVSPLQMIHLINHRFCFHPCERCSKQQLKVSLIGNNGSPMPQIVKTNPTTPVQAESQFDKKERGKAFRQVLAAFIANIGTINTGLIFGFSAVVIPQLQAPSSTITIDESQASWIGKLMMLTINLNLKAIKFASAT